MCHNCTWVSCVIDSNGAEQSWCVCNNLTRVRFTSMLMSWCVGGLAWLMVHIANRAVWKWVVGAKEWRRNKEALRDCGEGVRQPAGRVSGGCAVSLLGEGKYCRGLIPSADMFTEAEEQSGGRKIAFWKCGDVFGRGHAALTPAFVF